jgi:hypothetical protein
LDSGLLIGSAANGSSDSWRDRFAQWSRAQGKRTRWALYLLSASGIVLWDPIGLPWLAARQVLFLHVAASLVLFPLFVLPFWAVHRELLHVSRNAWQRNTGRALDILLAILSLSGVVLIVVGNPGNSIGRFAYWSHLLVALPLVVSLLLHVMRRVGASQAMAVLWAQIRTNRW